MLLLLCDTGACQVISLACVVLITKQEHSAVHSTHAVPIARFQPTHFELHSDAPACQKLVLMAYDTGDAVLS